MFVTSIGTANPLLVHILPDNSHMETLSLQALRDLYMNTFRESTISQSVIAHALDRAIALLSSENPVRYTQLGNLLRVDAQAMAIIHHLNDYNWETDNTLDGLTTSRPSYVGVKFVFIADSTLVYGARDGTAVQANE